ncbi:glycoside hydrolase superfamily, partial [Cyathus striatus]
TTLPNARPLHALTTCWISSHQSFDLWPQYHATYSTATSPQIAFFNSLLFFALQRGSLSSTSPSESLISTAWYTGWHSEDFHLSAVSWSKYTHLTYAFATTTLDVNMLFLDASDDKLLRQFVAAAHQHARNVTASLSVGGWTGSRWFSTNVGSAENRTSFVHTITKVATKYDLDGIDFERVSEYPGTQGIVCNIVNENDTDNFLSFLQELRNSTDARDLIISAATDLASWLSTNQPFVYNQTSQIYAAFDNAQSFTAKGNFINSEGLAGFAIWEAGGGCKDVLLDAVHKFVKHIHRKRCH